mmetsp:Transcript_9894/g.33546  ORF Transcript_9894/g.33546 Transcript_9894/m.33546 type:complete len:316 (-) Transcript_9894:166-1113(-)
MPAVPRPVAKHQRWMAETQPAVCDACTLLQPPWYVASVATATSSYVRACQQATPKTPTPTSCARPVVPRPLWKHQRWIAATQSPVCARSSESQPPWCAVRSPSATSPRQSGVQHATPNASAPTSCERPARRPAAWRPHQRLIAATHAACRLLPSAAQPGCSSARRRLARCTTRPTPADAAASRMTRARTSSPVSCGRCDRYCAAIAETCGVAMDVPDRATISVSLPMPQLRMSRPGAYTSAQLSPRAENSEIRSSPPLGSSMLPTEITRSDARGYVSHCVAPSFPAATTTVTPRSTRVSMRRGIWSLRSELDEIE